MAEPGEWAPAQGNDFSNFQSNDSFNLNEVTGIDGRSHQQYTFSLNIFYSTVRTIQDLRKKFCNVYYFISRYYLAPLLTSFVSYLYSTLYKSIYCV